LEKGLPISGELIKTNAMKVPAKLGILILKHQMGGLKIEPSTILCPKILNMSKNLVIVEVFKTLEKQHLKIFYPTASLKTYSMLTKLVYIFVFFLKTVYKSINSFGFTSKKR
jgi:hypothetical protein